MAATAGLLDEAKPNLDDSCFGLASQGGRVDIADYSALSRAMEEGFRRFRMSPPAFGIFNRTHNHESAERITRTIS